MDVTRVFTEVVNDYNAFVSFAQRGIAPPKQVWIPVLALYPTIRDGYNPRSRIEAMKFAERFNRDFMQKVLDVLSHSDKHSSVFPDLAAFLIHPDDKEAEDRLRDPNGPFMIANRSATGRDLIRLQRSRKMLEENGENILNIMKIVEELHVSDDIRGAESHFDTFSKVWKGWIEFWLHEGEERCVFMGGVQQLVSVRTWFGLVESDMWFLNPFIISEIIKNMKPTLALHDDLYTADFQFSAHEIMRASCIQQVSQALGQFSMAAPLVWKGQGTSAYPNLRIPDIAFAYSPNGGFLPISMTRLATALYGHSGWPEKEFVISKALVGRGIEVAGQFEKVRDDILVKEWMNGDRTKSAKTSMMETARDGKAFDLLAKLFFPFHEPVGSEFSAVVHNPTNGFIPTTFFQTTSSVGENNDIRRRLHINAMDCYVSWCMRLILPEAIRLDPVGDTWSMDLLDSISKTNIHQNNLMDGYMERVVADGNLKLQRLPNTSQNVCEVCFNEESILPRMHEDNASLMKRREEVAKRVKGTVCQKCAPIVNYISNLVDESESYTFFLKSTGISTTYHMYRRGRYHFIGSLLTTPYRPDQQSKDKKEFDKMSGREFVHWALENLSIGPKSWPAEWMPRDAPIGFTVEDAISVEEFRATKDFARKAHQQFPTLVEFSESRGDLLSLTRNVVQSSPSAMFARESFLVQSILIEPWMDRMMQIIGNDTTLWTTILNEIDQWLQVKHPRGVEMAWRHAWGIASKHLSKSKLDAQDKRVLLTFYFYMMNPTLTGNAPGVLQKSGEQRTQEFIATVRWMFVLRIWHDWLLNWRIMEEEGGMSWSLALTALTKYLSRLADVYPMIGQNIEVNLSRSAMTAYFQWWQSNVKGIPFAELLNNVKESAIACSLVSPILVSTMVGLSNSQLLQIPRTLGIAAREFVTFVKASRVRPIRKMDAMELYEMHLRAFISQKWPSHYQRFQTAAPVQQWIYDLFLETGIPFYTALQFENIDVAYRVLAGWCVIANPYLCRFPPPDFANLMLMPECPS